MPGRLIANLIPRPYTAREWQIGSVLFIAAATALTLFEYYIPLPVYLTPSVAIAAAALFFGGTRLWPFALAASVFSYSLLHRAPEVILFLSFAETLGAVIAAYVMRSARIDPLFRRFKDMLYTALAAVLAALPMPTVLALYAKDASFWGYAYVSALFSLLAVVPFILRWLAKPRFNRRPVEALEVIAVFSVLIAINGALFVGGVTTFLGIPLLYVLYAPLFYIALRLRPRFVSLAILITAAFAVGSALATGTEGMALVRMLFEVETYLVMLSLMFYVIVSLEEDRRLSSNLMKSQLHTLENAVSRISTESKAKNEFIAVLAHELRNPLAPIMTGIDFLRLKEDRDADEKETLVMMDDRMHTVKALLDDLLDISRISEGKISISREPIDLSAVIDRAIVSTDHHRVQRHQSLSVKGIKSRIPIEGDAIRLEQVFSNLLTNASKYSEPGSPIALSATSRDGAVEVVVSDKGIGIAPEALERIFTPFHQVDSGRRSMTGLGIGLALVRSFVLLHGGEVRAESAGENKGSRFTVRLPLTSTTEARVADVAPLPIAKPLSDGPFSVLVVDDSDAAAWGVGKLLELQGCTVAYAYDGTQAMDAAAETVFDVILLDIGLPDWDGFAVAQILRDRGFTGRLIALTGHGQYEAKVKGAKVGFDEYLVKPAGLSDLRRVIPGLS